MAGRAAAPGSGCDSLESPASVHLTLLGSDGTTVARTASPVWMGPYGVTQSSVQSYLGPSAGTLVQAATLLVEPASGTGRIVALGTAIDNVSQSFRALTVASTTGRGPGGRRRSRSGRWSSPPSSRRRASRAPSSPPGSRSPTGPPRQRPCASSTPTAAPTRRASPQRNVEYAEIPGFGPTSAAVIGQGLRATVLSSGLAKVEIRRTNLILTAGSGTGRVAGILTEIASDGTNATLVTPFRAAGPDSPGIGGAVTGPGGLGTEGGLCPCRPSFASTKRRCLSGYRAWANRKLWRSRLKGPEAPSPRSEATFVSVAA